MTKNQSVILVNNPHTKKAMAVLGKFAQLETKYKAMEEEAKAATELIKEAMIAGGVDKVTFDTPGLTGYITLSERTTYKAEDDFDFSELFEQVMGVIYGDTVNAELVEKMRFIKLALDTDKVKAQAVLTGELPAGVIESKTQYVTKKFKVAE